MSKKFNFFIRCLAVALVVFSLSGGFFVSAKNDADDQPKRKIVVFKAGVSEDDEDSLIVRHGGTKIKNLKIIKGKAAILSKKAEKELLENDAVLRIDDDIEIQALAPKFGSSATAQVLPWGIDRIDAEKAWPQTAGDPVRVAVIDTGIDRSHPDLSANLKGGWSAVWYTSNYNDDNGHGTHVAGVIGALNNSVGVIGVGPAIDLYGVKVLDRRGSGYLSDIIEGIDWAIQNKMQVINMSLGATVDVQSFHDAVLRANAAGIVQVAAAGNDGGAVNYPAAYPEVIAVSATDQNNSVTYWSSRGDQVDLAAPGVSIYSTYKNRSYKTLSGTSMASPHVAGAAALVLTTAPGSYDSDGDGKWDSSEVQSKLEATATDLGEPGKDSLYGAGLVNAFAAIQ